MASSTAGLRWALWLWLVGVGLFSYLSLLGLSACLDAACETRFMRVWNPLMIVQAVLIIAGAFVAAKDHVNVLIGLSIASPVTWVIAASLWTMVP